MAILGIQPARTGRGYTMPTEVAVTAFGLLGGVGGALAQILASRRLSTLSTDRISVQRVIAGAALGAVGTVAGALLVPTGM
jgi:hypothetical protein